MADVTEALDSMFNTVDERHFSYVKTKSDRQMRNERLLLVRRLLRFLENVDEDLTVMEVRQALEEELPA